MRKISFLAVLFGVIVLLAACDSTAGKTDGVEVSSSGSAKFTEEEIQQAADAVKKAFKKFEHCELQHLSYDEARSDAQVESYLQNGRGSENGATSENTIVLFSDFYVGPEAAGGWTPDSKYDDWAFILIRESKGSKWVVDDWGY